MSKESRFNKKVKNNKATITEMLLMFFLIGIIPFLVYAKLFVYPMYGTDEGDWIKAYDYFIIIKNRAILLVAAIMVIEKVVSYVTMAEMPKPDFRKLLKPVYVFSGLIVFSTILAFIFSDYKYIATRGAIERFESIWIHFSYIIIFVYSLNFFKKDNALKIFSVSILVSAFVVGGIGALQFVGYNPMAKDWFINLTTSEGSSLLIDAPGSFTTMYNTNTSGSYAVFMLFVLGIIFVTNKDIKFRIVTIIDTIFIGITFLNSYSEASYIAFIAGVGAVVLLTIVLLFINGKRTAGGALTGVVVASAVVVLFAITSVDSISSKFNSMLTSFIGPEATFTDWKQENNEFYFYNNDDDYIKIALNGSTYEVYEEENLLYTDSGILDVANTIVTEDFGTLTFVNFEINGERYTSFNEYFYIKNVADDYMLVDATTLAEVAYVPFVGFEGYGNLFTNRGYIWSRSIPLLLDRPIVGYGADVYSTVFPNYDVVGKALSGQPMDVIVDKPHNIYLNMAINNGTIYLIGFIGIVVLAFKNSFKAFFVKDENVNKAAVILYISGLVVYLVNGLSTDNLVIIIAMFWVYLALDNNLFRQIKFVEISEVETGIKSTKATKNSKANSKEVLVEKIDENNKKEVKEVKEVKEEIKAEEKAEVNETTESIVEEINYDEIGVSYADLVSKDKD